MKCPPFRFDVADERGFVYFSDMIECFEKYFGRTPEDAIRIVNEMWSGRIVHKSDILFTQPPYYWAYYHENRPDVYRRTREEHPEGWLAEPEWQDYLKRYYGKVRDVAA